MMIIMIDHHDDNHDRSSTIIMIDHDEYDEDDQS